MAQIDRLPDDLPLTLVDNGSEGGVTWTRLTDGEADYMVFYAVETRVETYYVID